MIIAFLWRNSFSFLIDAASVYLTDSYGIRFVRALQGLLMNFCNASSLQWSQGWSLSARTVHAYVVCFTEGFACTVM